MVLSSNIIVPKFKKWPNGPHGPGLAPNPESRIEKSDIIVVEIEVINGAEFEYNSHEVYKVTQWAVHDLPDGTGRPGLNYEVVLHDVIFVKIGVINDALFEYFSPEVHKLIQRTVRAAQPKFQDE